MAVFVNSVAIGSALASLMILVYQTFFWFCCAEWKGISLFDAVISLGVDSRSSPIGEWLYTNEGILETAPLSLSLMTLSIPIFWIAGRLFNREAQMREESSQRSRRRKRLHER